MFKKKSKERKPVNKEELKLSIADKVISVIWLATGGVLVYFGMKWGERYTEVAANRGFDMLHSLGYVKFFDDTGKELNMLEASKFIKSL